MNDNDNAATNDTTATPTTSAGLESPAPKSVWPALNYVDALAAIRFLVDVLGFVRTAVHSQDSAPEVVVHAELRWPEGGGVMLGTADRHDNEFSQMATGCASVYVVTDDPLPIHARCLAAGATFVRELREEDYGSLGFSVRDQEGNIWSFGTYRGE
jgi:uncharacterized glyoxalase superfamily protein PhnB